MFNDLNEAKRNPSANCYVDVKSINHECSWFSYDFFSLPTQKRLAAIRGTARGRHTDLRCALSGTTPRDLCLKDRTFRSLFLLVLAAVESFPGAQSPLGSKEPIELFV